MTAPTPGYSRDEIVDAYHEFRAAEILDAYKAELRRVTDFNDRMGAVMRPVEEHCEVAAAMAKLRRVCAGEPAGDMPPAPPSFVPLHPLYVPLGDTFRRQSSKASSGDPFGAILLLTVFGVLAIGYAIALMLGWL